MRFLDYNGLRLLIRISRTQVGRWTEDRGFPKPVKIGSRIFWLEAEVLEWLQQHLDSR